MKELDTKYTFCRFCESLCGLTVTTQYNKIIDIQPDENHFSSMGFSCCIKELKQHEMYSSPDRLKYPMKKTDTEFERISW